MKKYTLKYKIENYGDSIELLDVQPRSEYIRDCFYEGKVLRSVYLDNNGTFELTVMFFNDQQGEDCFGVVELHKT